MKKIILCIILTMIMATNAIASTLNYAIEGNNKITKANESIIINPYNTAKILGVGENKSITVLADIGKITIPIEAPLYKMSEVYRDRIINKDGIWGVERNVTKKVFDGSENWILEDNYKFRNDKTTLFSMDLGETLNFKDVISSHFDPSPDITHKSNIYDGITINKNRSKCDIRIMNVRNVTTLEAWEKYLEQQYSNGNPVSFLYISPQSAFEPFEQDIQDKLNLADMGKLGLTDIIMPTIRELSQVKPIGYPFNEENTWDNNGVDIRFLGEAIEDIKIYNYDTALKDKFYFDSVNFIEKENKCIMSIKNESGDKEFTGEFYLFDNDFLKNKATEVVFNSTEDTDIRITVMINFSKLKVPNENITGIKYEMSGISPKTVMEKELVLPSIIPVVEGHYTDLYYNNIILNWDINKSDNISPKVNDVNFNYFGEYLKYSPDEKAKEAIQSITLLNSSDISISEASTRFIPVPENAGKDVTKTVMFLGDSIIDQNYYTKSVKELFDKDGMKINLIGTRGKEDNRHEGRGGWSAYDYCTKTTQYGISNPFLNNGVFDFSYYMEENKFDAVDYVFINLGINDLNQVGYNTHDEILSNYDKMIKSIKSFNNDVKIFIGLPTMLFGQDTTMTAKNTRLNFIKDLKTKYDNQEENNIFTVPLYINVDPYNDFKFQETKQSFDNPDTKMIVKDTTHMGISGYKKIADITYNSFKYAQFIDELELEN